MGFRNRQPISLKLIRTVRCFPRIVSVPLNYSPFSLDAYIRTEMCLNLPCIKSVVVYSIIPLQYAFKTVYQRRKDPK